MIKFTERERKEIIIDIINEYNKNIKYHQTRSKGFREMNNPDNARYHQEKVYRYKDFKNVLIDIL